MPDTQPKPPCGQQQEHLHEGKGSQTRLPLPRPLPRDHLLDGTGRPVPSCLRRCAPQLEWSDDSTAVFCIKLVRKGVGRSWHVGAAVTAAYVVFDGF